MRVFVTGASGFVGSAIVKELLDAGHEVLGLARSEEGAKAVLATGAQVHRGDLQDVKSLQQGAEQVDGVIHTAFNHDFSNFKANTEMDRRVIEALGETLAGSNRPMIITSGIGILPSLGRLATEDDRALAGGTPRIASEEAADAVAAKGVKVAIMRLPPSVHGAGDHGFVPLLINLAREKGLAAYKGEGLNRWPAVHRQDAARLYRLVLENPPAPGTRVHALAEEGVLFREIAETIGKGLNVPVVSLSEEEANAYFGWFAHFAGIDAAASAQRTIQQWPWTPTQAELIEDMKTSDYFKA